MRGARAERHVDPVMRREVLAGLRAERKTISPKYFYDDRGAKLFEAICELPEYYLTRAELAILRENAHAIAALAGPRCAVIEYGSGAGLKIRILLDALERPASYTPVDISRRQLARVAEEIQREYPSVAVQPVAADYTSPFALPPLPAHERRLAFFPGSTIGNFHLVEAAAFLQRIRHAVGSRGGGGGVVLGADRRKDPAIHEAAYNDAGGVTAAFNLNLLERLNRELVADFDLARFRHRAWFNEEASRVEMHLESLRDQTVSVAGEPIEFEAGETIWTESSYKFDREALEDLAAAAGFRIVQSFSDRDERFWVIYMEAR